MILAREKLAGLYTAMTASSRAVCTIQYKLNCKSTESETGYITWKIAAHGSLHHIS